MRLGWLILAFLLLSAVIYGIDRGIYIGTTGRATAAQLALGTVANPEVHDYTVFHKNCRYLVTGIVELPARGGLYERMPGQRFDQDPDTLCCRFFGE
jgi:hypothetical protein